MGRRTDLVEKSEKVANFPSINGCVGLSFLLLTKALLAGGVVHNGNLLWHAPFCPGLDRFVIEDRPSGMGGRAN